MVYVANDRYDPARSDDFGSEEHDTEMLDWLDEARTNSDLWLLSGWARCRIEGLRAELAELEAAIVGRVP